MLGYRNCCCKDCKERYVGCHSKCQQYIKERDEYEALKKIIAKAKVKDSVFRSYQTDQIIKNKK